jgi:hypothetical protein
VSVAEGEVVRIPRRGWHVRSSQLGHVRIAGAVVAMAAVGLLSFGAFRSVSASPASWSADGSPSSEGHDLTPIVVFPNGDAMAIGGFSNGAPTVDVEVFDHTKQIWNGAGSLPSSYLGASLAGAQATLLSGGDILLTGGTLSQAPTNLAAVWNHTTGQWQVLEQRMNQGRVQHVAVALSSNRALIVGGSCTQNGPSDTELFDEQSDTFTSQGCTPGSSADHTLIQAAAVATSTDRVILTGGMLRPAAENPQNPPPDGTFPATNAVSLFSGGTWSALPVMAGAVGPSSSPLPSPGPSPTDGARLRHTASEVESAGTVYVVVAGGASQERFVGSEQHLGTASNESSFTLATTEVFSAQLGSLAGGSGGWQSGQPLPSARADLASVNLGGQILLAGGRALRTGTGEIDPAYNAPGLGISDAFLFDPGSRALSPTAPMLTGRFDFTVGLLANGQALAAGGFGGQSSTQLFAQTAELYAPATAQSSSSSSSSTSSATATPTPRPSFNPGQHKLTISVPVVHPGQPVRVTANGFTPGAQILVVLQPATVNSLQACGVGEITKLTAAADGTIAKTILVLPGLGTPQLVVTLCVIAPVAGGPANAAVPQAVGRVALLVQARGAAPPLFVAQQP